MHKLILGLLILLAALAVACGGDDEESPPAATEEATDEATATEEADGDDGTGETFSSSQLPVSVTVTIPDGWEQPSDADLPDLFAVIEPGRGFIDFLQPTQVYNRASETQSELSDPPADYVAWFNENALVDVLGTEPTNVGDLQGTRLELQNTSYSFALYKLSDGSDYELEISDHVYTYVLDADGTPIIVNCGIQRGGDFAEFSQNCDEVLSTVEFGT